MSQEIAFYVDKDEEVTVKTVQAENTVTYGVVAPMYSDLALTNNIGKLAIKKEVFNIVNGVVGPETFAIYTYDAFWMVPNVKGSSIFVINLGNQIIEEGSSEVPGTYYGACDGILSNGDFRNFGGSVRKIKDATPIRQYLLSYSPFNPYNTLPL
jgi:hypothetical protein